MAGDYVGGGKGMKQICGGCKGEIPPEAKGKFLVGEVENCSERCAEKVFRSAPTRREVLEKIREGVRLVDPYSGKQQRLF